MIKMLTENQNLPNLAEKIGLFSLYFKREDHHPLGSHKGRSLPFMIDTYRQIGKNKFSIFSSGNSALSSALYIKKINEKENTNIKLKIFIGNNINPEKEKNLFSLADKNISIKKTDRPKQEAFKSKEIDYQILRQSTDDSAIFGYVSLAKELEEIPDLESVFIPVSSGTLAQSLALNLPKNVRIFIVQSEKCHPIAEEFDQDFVDGDSSADAIVDKIAFRKEKLIELIKNSNGDGFVANDEKIKKAIEIFQKETGEKISSNGALTFAGLLKALEKNFESSGAVVCIVGGK